MKETPWAKQKRLLLEVKQQLFEVCNNPNSIKSKSIIIEQKMLKFQADNAGQFYKQLKELGFGKPKKEPFTHYEKKDNL